MERDEERPEADSEEELSPEEPPKAKAAKPTPEGETAEEPPKAKAAKPTPKRKTPEEPVEAQVPGPTPEGETPEEPAEAQVPGPMPEAEIPSERRPEEPRRYVLTAGISAAVVVFGAVLFLAGFWTHSLLDDDDDLSPIEEDLAAVTEQVGEIHGILGGAVGDGASPTPAPVVAASADDDPFIGPEDALVTIIEFSDFQ